MSLAAMKVLLVEDDRKLARFLESAFQEEGYAVDACRTGREMLEHAAARTYDCVVLDWMLPEMDGLSACRELRARGAAVPVLMLTARGDVSERVTALDAGADDYVPKPFHLSELLARMRALVRRASAGQPEILKLGDLTLDLAGHTVHVKAVRVDLTARELSVLALLARQAGRVVTRAEMLAQVWNQQGDPGSNVIEVTISNLREKLGSASEMLETVRGHGYRLSASPPAR